MLSAIITAHNDREGLIRMLRYLRGKCETIVIASDTDLRGVQADIIVKDYDRGDWGHEKRAMGLHLANEKWVGFFNSDDEYEEEYVEEMLSHTKGHDFIYCDFTSHLFRGNVVRSEIKKGYITSGNFIVRTSKGKGKYESRDYSADWDFINSVADNTYHIDKVLYHHR